MIKNYPERKKYNYVINTTKWKLEIKLQQETINETKDFYWLLSSIWSWNITDNIENIQKLNNYYIWLIKKWIDWWKWWQIRKKWKKRQLWLLVKSELASFIDEVIDYTHPLRESVYNEHDNPKINWKKPRINLFWNEYEIIYKKTWIPMNKIWDILTAEQVWWYRDRIVFEYFEAFKEWQKINDKLLRKHQKWWLTEQDKKDLEFIKSQNI